MSRWMLYRQKYQRRRNALLLLTLSGAIRSADVEVSFLRERRFSGPRKGATSTADALPHAGQSIWSMDLRRLFSKHVQSA
jgi:hypothetical protein